MDEEDEEVDNVDREDEVTYDEKANASESDDDETLEEVPKNSKV